MNDKNDMGSGTRFAVPLRSTTIPEALLANVVNYWVYGTLTPDQHFAELLRPVRRPAPDDPSAASSTGTRPAAELPPAVAPVATVPTIATTPLATPDMTFEERALDNDIDDDVSDHLFATTEIANDLVFDLIQPSSDLENLTDIPEINTVFEQALQYNRASYRKERILALPLIIADQVITVEPGDHDTLYTSTIEIYFFLARDATQHALTFKNESVWAK